MGPPTFRGNRLTGPPVRCRLYRGVYFYKSTADSLPVTSFRIAVVQSEVSADSSYLTMFRKFMIRAAFLMLATNIIATALIL